MATEPASKRRRETVPWRTQVTSLLSETSDTPGRLETRCIVTSTELRSELANETDTDGSPTTALGHLTRFKNLCTNAQKGDLEELGDIFEKFFASKVPTIAALHRLKTILAYVVSMGFLPPRDACLTVIKYTPLDPDRWRIVVDSVLEFNDINDGGKLNTGIIIAELLQRFSDDTLTDNETKIRCGMQVAELLRELCRKKRGLLSELAMLSDWVSGAKPTRCWPLEECIAAIGEEFAAVSEFILPLERSKILPILLPGNDAGASCAVDILLGDGSFGMSSRVSIPSGQSPAADAYFKCLDNAASSRRPDIASEDIVQTLLYTRPVTVDVNSLHQSEGSSITQNRTLEKAMATLLKWLVRHEAQISISSTTTMRWHQVADIFFGLAEKGLISPQRCLREMVEGVQATSTTGNNRVIWFVLQQALAHKALLSTDHTTSRAVGKKSIVDLVARFYVPVSSGSETAKQNSLKPSPEPRRLGDRSLGCLVLRQQHSSGSIMLTDSNSFPDVDGDILQNELSWLSELNRVEIERKLHPPQISSILSYEQFLTWVHLGSAYNSLHVNSMFEQQCSVNGSALSGRTDGKIAPLPVTWVDVMPIWLKLRFKKLFFDQLQYYKEGKASLLPSGAAVETFARIELSMPHAASTGLLNTVDEIAKQLSPASFEKNMQDSGGKQMLHCLLELVGYRLLTTMNVASRFRLLELIMGCIHLANDRRLYSLVQAVAQRLLTSVELTSPSLILDAASSWKYDKSTETASRFTVCAIARTIGLTYVTGHSQWESSTLALLAKIQKATPLHWCSSALATFPQFMKKFYESTSPPAELSFGLVTDTAQNEYGKALFNQPPNTKVDAVAFFTKPEYRKIFLCVMVFHLGQYELVRTKVTAVLQSIPRQELTEHICYMLAYITSALIDAQQAGQFDAYLNFFVGKLKDLIFQHRFFNFDEIVTLLVRGEMKDANNIEVSVKILQDLLFCNQFLEQVSDYCAKVVEPLSIYPDNYHISLSNHLGTIPVAIDQTVPMTRFYDCLSSRMLPVIGNVLTWLLDMASDKDNTGAVTPVSAQEIIKTMHEKFGSLFKHHDSPRSTLYRILYRYNALLSQNRDLAMAIANLYGVAANPCPDSWTFEYTSGILDRIASACSDLNPPDHRFSEIPSSLMTKIVDTTIEMMLRAPPLEQFLSAASKVVMAAPSFARVNALAYLIRMLPVSHQGILELLAENWTDPSLMDNGIVYVPSVSIDDPLEASAQSKPRVLGSLIHALWTHDKSRDIFGDVVTTFIGSVGASLSRNQARFVCHLVGCMTPGLPINQLDKLSKLLGKMIPATLGLLNNLEPQSSTATNKAVLQVVEILDYFSVLTSACDLDVPELADLHLKIDDLHISFASMVFSSRGVS